MIFFLFFRKKTGDFWVEKKKIKQTERQCIMYSFIARRHKKTKQLPRGVDPRTLCLQFCTLCKYALAS